VWYNEIALQLGDRSVNEVKGECKLKYGVPILRAENEEFRLVYDKFLKPFSYEEKLEFIIATDLPVTRLMSTPQMTRYMDEVQRVYAMQGVRLTNPDDMKYEEMKGR
jgi:hypothetical protein